MINALYRNDPIKCLEMYPNYRSIAKFGSKSSKDFINGMSLAAVAFQLIGNDSKVNIHKDIILTYETFTYIHTRIHTRIHINTHIYTYIYTYKHTHTHIYIYNYHYLKEKRFLINYIHMYTYTYLSAS